MKHYKKRFWELYELLKVYYPLGLIDVSVDPTEYPGKNLLDKSISANLSDNNKQSKWKDAILKIGSSLKLKAHDTTVFQKPTYSCDINLVHHQTRIGELKTTLHLTKSFLGPYFTFFITEFFIKNRCHHTIRQIVNPTPEYSDTFYKVIKEYKRYYPEDLFVPFLIYRKKLSGLSYFDDDERIFHALFNHQMNFNCEIVEGEFSDFEMKEWKNNDSSWIIGSP